MKQVLLASALILLPIAVFSGVNHYLVGPDPGLAVTAPLGDVSQFASIVSDTQAIAARGDLTAAERRITDLENLWDDAESKLQPQAPVAWGNVDAAADAAFAALRAPNPDAGQVSTVLAGLQATLADPAKTEGGMTESVAGIVVTDAAGHPLPCEMMLNDLRDTLQAGHAAPDSTDRIKELRERATERCNADDDRRADSFTAQALALVTP